MIIPYTNNIIVYYTFYNKARIFNFQSLLRTETPAEAMLDYSDPAKPVRVFESGRVKLFTKESIKESQFYEHFRLL